MVYGTTYGIYGMYRSVDTDAPEHVPAIPIIAAVATYSHLVAGAPKKVWLFFVFIMGAMKGPGDLIEGYKDRKIDR